MGGQDSAGAVSSAPRNVFTNVTFNTHNVVCLPSQAPWVLVLVVEQEQQQVLPRVQPLEVRRRSPSLQLWVVLCCTGVQAVHQVSTALPLPLQHTHECTRANLVCCVTAWRVLACLAERGTSYQSQMVTFERSVLLVCTCSWQHHTLPNLTLSWRLPSHSCSKVLKTPCFLKLNPRGMVPILVDGYARGSVVVAVTPNSSMHHSHSSLLFAPVCVCVQ